MGETLMKNLAIVLLTLFSLTRPVAAQRMTAVLGAAPVSAFTPTFVRSGSGSLSTSGNSSIVTTMTAAVTAGDRVGICLVNYGSISGSIGSPALTFANNASVTESVTFVVYNGGTYAGLSTTCAYIASAVGGWTTFTITDTAGTELAYTGTTAVEITKSSGVLDGTPPSSATTTTGTNPITVAITASANNDVVFSEAACSGSTLGTPGTGLTRVGSTNMAYGVIPAGSFTASWSVTSAGAGPCTTFAWVAKA